MEITVNHLEASKQHPSVVKRWIAEAEFGKIQFNPDKARWSYTFCVKVAGMSGGDFVKKLGTGELTGENIERSKKTPEEVADEILSNVVGLSINVSYEGFSREQSIKKLPKLFIEKYRTIIITTERELLEEQKRFESLTPQEREREEREMVKELFGQEDVFGFRTNSADITSTAPAPVSYDLNDILDKISRVGVDGLTKEEKVFMDEHSKK